jgi:hypothetical protein
VSPLPIGGSVRETTYVLCIRTLDTVKKERERDRTRVLKQGKLANLSTRDEGNREGMSRAHGLSGDESLADGEMHMVALTEGKADREAGVDADGGAVADVKVAAAEVSSDGGSLFLGEIARTLVGPECGAGGAGECSAVVVVLLVVEIGGALEGGVHRRRGELDRVGGCGGG